MPKYITDISGFFSGSENNADIPNSFYLRSDYSVWMITMTDSGSLSSSWIRDSEPPPEPELPAWVILHAYAYANPASASRDYSLPEITSPSYPNTAFIMISGAFTNNTDPLSQSSVYPFTGALSYYTTSSFPPPTLWAGGGGEYTVYFSDDVVASGSDVTMDVYFWALTSTLELSQVPQTATWTVSGSSLSMTFNPLEGCKVVSGSINIWDVTYQTMMTQIPNPPESDYDVYSLSDVSDAGFTVHFSPEDATGDGIGVLVGWIAELTGGSV